MQCPECTHKYINVVRTITATLVVWCTPEGGDLDEVWPETEPTWEPTDPATCTQCFFEGTVQDFLNTKETP